MARTPTRLEHKYRDHLILSCEVIFVMSSCCFSRLITRIRSELSRINPICAGVGAGVVLLLGFISAMISRNWSFGLFYRLFEKPPGSPPAFVFPIVWTFLYLLIGAAAGAVVCVNERALAADKWRGLLFFGIMLVFNLIWSPLFFGAGAFFAAFLAIIVMIVATLCVISAFRRIFFVSTAAMTVYLIWLIYAAYLNIGVIALN